MKKKPNESVGGQMRELLTLLEAENDAEGAIYTAKQIDKMSTMLGNFGLTTTTANGHVIVRGTTYPVRDVLSKFGFKFKKSTPESSWERKGIGDLDFFMFYRSMLKKFQSTESVNEETEPMNYAALLSFMLSLKTGDMVEITYAPGSTSPNKTVKREVSMSWTEFRDQASRSDNPGTSFHFKFKAKPTVLLGPSKANKAHLKKPGGGGGTLHDYGDSIMFQATISTKVKPVVALRRA